MVGASIVAEASIVVGWLAQWWWAGELSGAIVVVVLAQWDKGTAGADL